MAKKFWKAVGAALIEALNGRNAQEGQEAREARDAAEFQLRKYELDRDHELELNKFAHALEVERLKILQLVNGGAFTVLVAFATSLVSSPGCSRGLAIFAGLSWVLGLGAAAWATQRQLDGQANFNTAYRRRRNAVELRQLGRIHGEGAAAMIPPLGEERRRADEAAVAQDAARNQREEEEGKKPEPPPTAESYEKKADTAFYAGKDSVQHVKDMAIASILLFILGGLLLAGSLALADPSQLGQGEKAAPSSSVTVKVS